MKKWIRGLKNYYLYNTKLSHKLMISYWLLLAIPTIAVSIFIYGQIYQIVVSDTILSEHQLAQQTVNTVESTLRQIGTTSNIITSDSYLSGLRISPDADIANNYSSSDQTASFIKAVNSYVDGSLIKNIKIYMDEPFASLYTHDDSGILQPMDEAKGTYWYGIFSGTSVYALYCPSFYLSPSEVSTYGGQAHVQRISYENQPEKTAAYVVIYYDQTTLDDSLKQDLSNNSSVTYIINRRSSLVATSDKTLSGTYFMDYPTLTTSLSTPNTFVIRQVLEEKVYISYYPINGTDWYLVSVIPAAPLLEREQSFILRFVGVYLIFLAVAFFLAFALSRSITRRISRLIQQMKTVRSGKLMPAEMMPGKDEISELTDTYNYMTDRINGLLESQIKSAEQLRVAEFNALQAQINPHFLYNTLDMINWLSHSGQSNEVTEAVQALSSFYKLTLSKKDSVNTVEQELTHVSLYVRLQNMRYRDHIAFIVDVPDELMECEIPKLTFQPIVENAIQHGILEKEDKSGTIVITAWTESGDIVFLISDNGCGMDAQTMGKILSGTSESKHGSNIGVYNTHQRLQVLYGDRYGLFYSSTLMVGTDVMIRIPYA